ncbi:hypothetical protein PF010_g15359 [Phytophthora fragariae]|uniref:Uncharacterized protein n=1 Tax=Phytophthora fragariae TaxID=53985 RepID=A0A6A3K182_9STRA|nr:hypothetical protein PF011_g14646 [Phytophthora fragariae]KAE9098967.1 hypothetical protein PF010_g15359 [Phytophthora fragariae]
MADPKASGSVAPAGPPSSPPQPSTPAPPSSINMFYPIEREDSAAPLSIIEEGDEHDLGAEAFADMAMGGMDMSLELNSLQIRAFLARNEAQSESTGAFTAAAVREEPPKPQQQQTPEVSAYEALRNGTVHYSRREDKVRALQEHPVVASVASDGRTVGCKCGRNVRLNPPWYILKFEQHVASRNCSFLRQGRPSSKKRKREEVEVETGAATGENVQQADSQRREGGEEGTGAGAGQEHSQSQDGNVGEGQERDEAGDDVGKEREEEEMDESGEYSLQAVDAILRREFGVVQDSRRVIVPPTANAPGDRVRMFKGAMTLRDNAHFTRITPDGRFAECKCSRIVLLGGPWQPGQFLMHVADKQKPKKRAKPSSPAMGHEQWKTKRGPPSGISPTPTARTMISAGVLMRSPTSASALLQAHKAKKSFPREIRWDIARARGLLPCPGLRDERMNTFVASAVQLTGGARQRQKIARELFPHLFPDNSEYDQTDEESKESDMEHRSTPSISKKRQPKLQQQLLEAEKMLLHDVIEGEALWFVDKDGNSVRSLDCLAIIDSGKGEIRSNVSCYPQPRRKLFKTKNQVIRYVDLSSFPTSAGMQSHQTNHPSQSELPIARNESETRTDGATDGATGVTSSETLTTGDEHDPDDDVDESKDADGEGQMESDPAAVAFLSELAPPEDNVASKADDVVMPTDHVPCTGLRDENVQAYVANAVQIVGGSRPRYVIARELFPRVFGNDKKVRIVDKLDDEQRLVLQDAVFSECLWRVDKEGRCVRSLRCKRFIPVSDNHDRANPQYQGVCRACRDLRTVPNFRSVLSRSKVPKKLENIKYVPSVYTESDPFLRKLSKNAAFRGLYQTVKRLASPAPGDSSEAGAERLKRVYFWLRFARMGVFGYFKSHPVFEGLMKSMVEIKDKERRGVGKQNMQYSRALDEFMQSMAQTSTEAFELFAAQFCGRTLRSQKVKRRTTPPPVFSAPLQTTTEGVMAEENSSAVVPVTHTTLQPHQHQQYLMPPDDLLSGRSLSTEESQRFMDRMMAEVTREIQLAAGHRPEDITADATGHEQPTNDEDESNRVGPETYLNDEGVLTTEI